MNREECRLNAIYDKTDGYCHLCYKKLSFKNYGLRNVPGGWHIEHSVPKALGGTDHMNNLFAACILCNIAKGIQCTKTIRNRNGYTRAPYSVTKKREIQYQNTFTGMVIGGMIGRLIGGNKGTLIGIAIGGTIGNNQ